MPASVRPRWQGWVVLATIVAIVVGAVAIAGGFARSTQTRRTAEPGEVFDTTRWRVSVLRAEYTDQGVSGLEISPKVRVWMSLTNISQKSLYTPALRTIVITLPDGTKSQSSPYLESKNRSGMFFPDIPREVAIDVEPDSAGPVVGSVSVVVHDEEPRDGYISSDTWDATLAGTTVLLDCVDVRVAR